MAFLEPLIAVGEIAGEAAGAAAEGVGAAAEGAAGAAEGAAEAAEGIETGGGRGAGKVSQGKHHTITKTYDGTEKLMRVLKAFEAERVLVGIPSNKADRSNTERGALNNATIGYIMEHGSPGANIPARPWLAPGIRSAKSAIVAHYEQAAKRGLKSGDVTAMAAAHRVIGQLTVDAVKRYITSGHFAPLAPSTVAQRSRQRGTRRRVSETKYLALIAAGMTPALAQNIAGVRPLINTGQMRNAVTYVVRKKGAPGTYRGTKMMRVV
jgi:hypothetical protein